MPIPPPRATIDQLYVRNHNESAPNLSAISGPFVEVHACLGNACKTHMHVDEYFHGGHSCLHSILFHAGIRIETSCEGKLVMST